MTAAPFAGTARFRPLGLIGRGSMGAVHRAWDDELGCVVALKTLEHLAPEQIYRLKQEFRFVAGLTHPNLVQLHELVVTDDACFFTMELVEGGDFAAWVRGGEPSPRADELVRRFVAVAPALVRGIAALHAAGRLHRDVKPSNVRVTAAGRVVLLDFDLGVWLAPDRVADGVATAGTLAYMAPEQAWGRPLGEAADWYSTGVLFHEALTGTLPFAGLPTHFLYSSDGSERPRLGGAVAGLPAPLADLLTDLLDADPARRPSGDAIAARLATLGADEAPPDVPATAQPSGDVPLVGRDDELARLRTLVERPERTTAIALVDGPSGIGKSKLVQTLLAGIERDPRALVLRGRCHAQESVPYKALDGVVDALSTFLVAQPDAELLALLPEHVGALAHLFPVLARVPAIAGARAATQVGDSPETRRRGAIALRDLLATIAGTRRLVVWIDDLQWGDRDSAALLARVLEPADAPALALIASYRADERAGIPLLDDVGRLSVASGGPIVLALHLEPLTEADAERLAWALSPPESRSAARIATITRDAGGSPFLIGTMVRSGVASAAGEGARGRLDDVVGDLVRVLPDEERALIELVAVAGTPIDRRVLLRAHVRGEAGRPLLAALESRSLVRAMTRAGQVVLEAYHDRIREGVLAGIPAPALAERNRTLANAFESSGQIEPERLARLLHDGGELGRAAAYALAAGDKASSALAFERAAEFYRAAREWDPRDAAWTRTLLRREGDALVNAGRFVDGAGCFLQATDGAPPLEALDFRRRASEQLLAGGRIDDGVATLSALLRDVGLSYPATPQRAMLSVATRVVVLLARPVPSSAGMPRGGGHAPSAVRATSEWGLVRVDACYSAAKSLSDVDPMRGLYFSLESLAQARAAGEPVRLGRSLAIVGGTIAALGGATAVRRGTRMIDAAREIAAATGSLELRGTIDICEGQMLMLGAAWRPALVRSDAGVQLLSEQCPGHAFECNVGRTSALRALEELGELRTLATRARQQRDAAAAAGNQYAELAAAGHLVLTHLAADEVASARELARLGSTMWTPEGFHLQHFYALRTDALCDLYGGRPAAAYARLETTWPSLRRSGLLRVPLARVDALALRARLAVATARSEPSRRRRLIRAAERDAIRLARERRVDATVHAGLLLAATAALRDDVARAIAHLDAAAATAERAEMRLQAAVARARKGELAGGADGRSLVARARDEMRRAGVVNPDRWIALHAPGFADGASLHGQGVVVNGR